MATVQASEHAARYIDYTHINFLSWDRESISYFLHGKLKTIPDSFFDDPRQRSVASWLGLAQVHSGRTGAEPEEIESYLLRHTRLVPRDIIILGNHLCTELQKQRGSRRLTEEQLRHSVAHVSAILTNTQLALCVNQVTSDLMEKGAVKSEYDHVYLRPNEHQINDARLKIVQCIEATGEEVFDQGTLDGLDETARHLFDSDKLHLANILWQQKLLGRISEDPGKIYFDGSGNLATTAVRTGYESQKYVWNPMIFDVTRGIRPTLSTPLWPTR
jgi:hypothetical protein